LLFSVAVQAQSLSAQFEMILPLAATWAAEQQARVLEQGVPLSIRELADALRVGVKDPEQVRLLQVETIPAPSHPVLQAAYQRAKVPTAPRGLTLYYGIFVRADYWRDRALIVHELVHTAQYERLGGIEPFLKKYLLECATIGYHKSPMEEEANTASARVLGHPVLVSA
jgi:hypothetical protein